LSAKAIAQAGVALAKAFRKPAGISKKYFANTREVVSVKLGQRDAGAPVCR